MKRNNAALFHGDNDVARLLSDPLAGWVRGDTGQPDAARPDLDEEQHVKPGEEHGVDREEGAGHDADGLGAEEGAPGGGRRSPRRGFDALGDQHATIRAGRDATSQSRQFSLDALGFAIGGRPMGGWLGRSNVGTPSGGATRRTGGVTELEIECEPAGQPPDRLLAPHRPSVDKPYRRLNIARNCEEPSRNLSSRSRHPFSVVVVFHV